MKAPLKQILFAGTLTAALLVSSFCSFATGPNGSIGPNGPADNTLTTTVTPSGNNLTAPPDGQNQSSPDIPETPMLQPDHTIVNTPSGGTTPGSTSIDTTNPSAGPSSQVITPGTSIGPGSRPFNDNTSLNPFNPSDIHYLDVTNPIVGVSDRYTYEYMVSDIQRLQQQYGSLMTVQVIGQSLDGRDIYDIIVGNPSAQRSLLIQGGLHAREYMNPLLVMKQMELCLTYYNTATIDNYSLSSLLSNTNIHFIPMSNPDGTTISQLGIDGIRSEDLRQTILNSYQFDLSTGRVAASLDSYLRIWKSNARGVDLNHNFDAGWAGLMNDPGQPSFSNYRGPMAASEPETQALVNVTLNNPIKATLSYHSMGSILYWDYALNMKRGESQQLANIISGVTGYRLMPSTGGGGYKDWAQSKFNPIPGITLEVGTVSCPLPITQYPLIWAQNKAVWAKALVFASQQP